MRADIICKNVLSVISSVKGVLKALILTDKDRRKILELEEEAEKTVISGLGYRDNQGVKIALQRKIVVGFATDMSYVWPAGPNLLLKWEDRIIGGEITKSQRKQLETNQSAAIIGNFVLYKDRMPTAKEMMDKLPLVVFPPTQPSQLKEVQGINDVVQGSPGSLTDNYLKKRMMIKLDDPKLGTAIIGFNIKNT